MTARPVFDAVMRWARRHPERICVVEGERRLTFKALLEFVAQAHHQLKRTGVGPGDLVAISCSRRGPAVAAMLAAWAAGAAYTPVVPTLPPGRIAQILSCARPRAILGDGADPWGPPACTPCPDGLRRLNPATAYVIFTSGSTGAPKGVILGHAGLDALVRWHGRVTGLVAGEFASQLADLGFDASVWEIWGALAHGARICVPSMDELLDPVELQGFLLRNQVRAGFVPTGLMPGLLDLDWPSRVPLRVLFTGGDRLTRWPEHRHPFRLINAYGPTECTVVATSHPLSPDGAGESAPPIGHALPHVTAAVVGPDGSPVPPGESGELWLAGPAVAYGYLGGVASDRFVRSDLGAGQRRWYRTGDLVREGEGGALHYLSRVDDQVQIGGRRTEPAEITRAILTLPQITDAVVFTRETAGGQLRLAAAVTPATVSRTEVHRHLEQILPPFMIPSDVLALETLPLTGRGKFDVAALRAACA